MTWMYLSRLASWEKRLPAELRALVQPPTDPYADLGKLKADGPFALFPNYDTTKLIYSVEKANLLAHAAGWGVLNNEATFRAALQP